MCNERKQLTKNQLENIISDILGTIEASNQKIQEANENLKKITEEVKKIQAAIK